MLHQIKKQLLLLTICLTSIISNLCYSQSVVCRLPRVEGFDNEYTTGYSVCGETTDRMSNTKIYVTVKDENLYVHSNYVTPGFDNPTKLATTEQMNSVEEIAMNIFFAEYPSETMVSQMNAMLNNNIDVIIDPKVLNNSKYGSINFSKVGRVKFLCPDNEMREAIKIKNSDGGFDFGIKYNNQFSTRVKGQNLNFIFSGLRTQKIDFKNIKIINLIDNSSTKSLLTTKFSEKTIPFDFSSKETFKNLLLSNKGKRTVILGHIENGDFVTIDKAGKEIFRIPISEIETFQKDNKLELIMLGCNSAGEGAGSGTLNKFNSIDALNRLKTTEKTENIEQFLDSLSFGTLHFLIDETFFTLGQGIVSSSSKNMPDRIDISIYEKSKGEIKSLNSSNRKGSIIVLGLGTADLYISSDVSNGDISNINQISQTDTTSIDPNDRGDKSGKSNNTILFIVIGVIMVGIVGYILKSSNKS